MNDRPDSTTMLADYARLTAQERPASPDHERIQALAEIWDKLAEPTRRQLVRAGTDDAPQFVVRPSMAPLAALARRNLTRHRRRERGVIAVSRTPYGDEVAAYGRIVAGYVDDDVDNRRAPSTAFPPDTRLHQSSHEGRR